MIADATPAAVSGLPFGWFDLVFLVLLAWGLFRGRHNGMTKELLPLLQWLAILFICGLACPILGPILMVQLKVSRMWGFLAAYAAVMLAILIPFSMLKHRYTKDLATSDVFKSSEYYLGMIAGMVKWFCIVLVGMALLNAPVYTKADIAAHEAYVHQVYGGGQAGYSGDFFPTVQTIQQFVLKNSASGTWVRTQPFLSRLLINTQEPGMPVADEPAKPQPVMMIGNKSLQ
ncbi:MAG: CvpA family protein [Limisphaerales bacterium]